MVFVRCAVLCSLVTARLVCAQQADVKPFRIQVVDDATGRGVPLVELKTVNDIRYVTDSAGVIAFHEPGLMDETVFCHVASHGYEFPADGFGYHGTRVKIVPGGSATLKIKRLNIAERLYRVTGAGIYRDSVMLDDDVPLQHPVLNAGVLGSDSVMTALFKGRLYWFWGDTNRASYPLGNFHVPGAVSELPANGGLPVADGINLDYFVGNDGFAKETCRMPGDGPTWIDGLVTVGDGNRQRLFAKYVKIRPPLQIYERGIVEFNDDTKQFEHRLTLDGKLPLVPEGHAFTASKSGRPNDRDYIYFANPYPVVRVPATADALLDPDQYEAWTYFAPGEHGSDPKLDRDKSGTLRLDWKHGTRAVDPKVEQRLLTSGLLQPEERFFRLTDANGERSVTAHRGSVAFNAHRKRWVMIFTESFGEHSALGDVWYAESDVVTGPWERAARIVTHDRYSFYNPKHHSIFDEDDGRVIYFEGTYTRTFSATDTATPRYDYNQVMYRLNLDDPRLATAQ